MLLRGCHLMCARALAGLVISALAVAAPAPASAQGFLEFLFGGLRRSPPPPVRIDTPSDFFDSLFDGGRRRETLSGSGGIHAGYCVRLCDGRYFPIQSHRNASAATQCSAMCPASRTKVFGGSDIEHARAGDGQRYGDLPNAFLYRERMVQGCTCDGKSSVGLVTPPAAEDPTLRPGDIVATNSGLAVYTGRTANRQAGFTPIDAARVPASLRNQLADVKVTPRPPSLDAAAANAAPEQTASIAADRRRLSAR